jgi:sialate O-acetylesterase
MIKNWRAIFAQGDLPFIWVQLPNYNMGTEFGDNWAGVREAQNMTLSVPNTAQVVTIDIGQGNEIHPNNKDKIGHRLANVALVHVYGDKTIVDSGPIFDHADLASSPVRIHFTHVEGGLKQAPLPEPKPAPEGTSAPAPKPAPTGINGFRLAGADKVFHPAEATIDAATNTVLVSSSAVSTPVAIRYAWSNDPEQLSLVNSADLPLAPFRTDDWPEPPPPVHEPKAPAATTPTPATPPSGAPAPATAAPTTPPAPAAP